MVKVLISLLLISLTISSCAVIPVSKKFHLNKCNISSDKKTLKIIDVAKETNTYYSISGIMLTPIIIPATAIISGSYVLVNNIYNLGEEKIRCSDD